MTRAAIVKDLQTYWWMVGLVGALVGALGFQTLSPQQRLNALEHRAARHDSLIGATRSEVAGSLRQVQVKVDALIAGACVKEKEPMARIVYGCS